MQFSGANRMPGVYWAALLLVVCMLLAGIADSQGFANSISWLNREIYYWFGSFYLWFALITVLIFAGLALMPFGRLKLGGEDARPEFSFFSWFSMIFCAGMGTGFLFWGAAEPLYHFVHPPLADTMTTTETADLAFAYTFFHWGLSPWAIYGMTSLAMGYFCFNRKQNFRFSTFLMGSDSDNPDDRKYLRGGVDLMVVLAVIFGISATLGMAVLSIEGGLQTLMTWKPSFSLKLGIIALITWLFMLSSFRGMDRGIKVLSNISMALGILLLGIILFVGPVDTLALSLLRGIGLYIARFPQMSLGIGNYHDQNWVGDWTVTYWSWWIAWAPFVGVFLAMISRGRTIRQIVLATLIAPTAFSCLWFGAFGQAAIMHQQAQGFSTGVVELVEVNRTLFELFRAYHLPDVVAWFSMLLVLLSVANSIDSATYTIANLSQSDYQRQPAKGQLLAWGLLFSLLTALLLLTGGIRTLESVTTVMVLPFTVLLALVYVGFLQVIAADTQPEDTESVATPEYEPVA